MIIKVINDIMYSICSSFLKNKITKCGKISSLQ